jgi:hypothetical protein
MPLKSRPTVSASKYLRQHMGRGGG